MGDSLTDYMFEAQLSIVITGLDNWFWTAYCLADVYFKGLNHVDDVNYYYQEKLDPISGGRESLTTPQWDPREYFLIVLSYRIVQVREEWKNVISELLRQIKPHVCPLRSHLSLCLTLCSRIKCA
jgi:hypothetical protein